MAITYTESNALMNDPDFRGRVKVACLNFASYILNEPTVTPAHNTRAKWATHCYEAPDVVASQVQPPTVMDSAVQNAGSAIDDAGLQAAVETTVNKMI